MKGFKKIGIYSSAKDKKILQISKQVEEIIKNLERTFFHAASSLTSKSSKAKSYSDNYIVKKVDLIVAIGGDGTLLSSARKFGLRGIPITGINLGNLGFLTDIAPEEVTSSLTEIILGKYSEDRRFFLEARIGNQKEPNIALNEIVIHSGSVAHSPSKL